MLVVAPGVGRTFREAPEIDGIVPVPDDLETGSFADLVVTGAAGPDLEAARSAAPTGDGDEVTEGATTATPNGAGRMDDVDHASDASVTTFGPSALLTPANGITALRLSPPPSSWPDPHVGGELVAFVARGAVWPSPTASTAGWPESRGRPAPGAFLDPLADKVAVLAALVALVVKGIIWWVPVAHHRRARDRHERVPRGRRPPRHLDAGPTGRR